MIECSVCHSRLVSPTTKSVSRAYDRHKNRVSSKLRVLNVFLVVGDCMLVGLQPILVYMSKVDGRFKFSPISVNFLTELAKVLFAIVMLVFQAARNNVLLAVPAFLYAINNYLKFIHAAIFQSRNCKNAEQSEGVGNCRFVKDYNATSIFHDSGTTALGLPVATGAYVYTLIFVTVPSLASVYNEYALKSQYDTSIYLQVMYCDLVEFWFRTYFYMGYGAIFNFLGILGTVIIKGPESFDILQGHSKATMLLIFNNAAQGILSSFFFKYADTILKKYSSTVATIFTGIASAALFGHKLTINFLLGISIVFISMHQFFSPLSKVKDEPQNGMMELREVEENPRSKDSFINMTAGANEEASHRVGSDERQPLLPT
ncbi:hypothetical protein Patl1_26291 [Pistacia atlantica]|uniref:Uncharacterized protein n=1 Tax=Pistacia atlantica TaxID=434234 RepID=A0ACC1B407_9ROSI|nr:hypothetical protein Patl1_26291 [Pistacia atlantica]